MVQKSNCFKYKITYIFPTTKYMSMRYWLRYFAISQFILSLWVRVVYICQRFILNNRDTGIHVQKICFNLDIKKIFGNFKQNIFCLIPHMRFFPCHNTCESFCDLKSLQYRIWVLPLQEIFCDVTDKKKR